MHRMPFVTTARVSLPGWRDLSRGVQRPTLRQYRFPSFAARLRFQQLVMDSQGRKPAHLLRLEAIRWARDHDGSTPTKACPVPIGAGGVVILTPDMPRFIRPVV